MRYMFRNLGLFLVLACFALIGKGQEINPTSDVKWPLITITGTDTPIQVCNASNYGQPFQRVDVTPNKTGSCGSDGWQYRGGGSGTVNAGTTGQIAGYSTGGTAVSGFNLGTNLSLAGNTINAVSSALPTGRNGQGLQSDGAAYSPTYNAPFFANAGVTIMGDSWMNGGGVVWNSQALNYIVCSYVGGFCNNLAVSGSRAPDEAINQFWPNVRNSYTYPTNTVIEVGVNDANSGGVPQEQNYQYTLQGMIAGAAIPESNKVWGSNFTSNTGSWSAFTTVPGVQGIVSTTNGSTITYTVGGGTKVDVAWWAADSNGGTATLSIDGGAATDTLAASGFGAVILTGSGTSSTIFDKQYSVPTASSHTVVITVTSATSASNKFAVIFVGTPTALLNAGQPSVYVFGVPFQNADAKSATTAAFNTIASNLATTYAAEGLPVRFVNVRAFANSSTDMQTIVASVGGQTVTDAVSTTGATGTTITSATANFSPSVVPPGCTPNNTTQCWPIIVEGAGTAAGNLNALIVGYTSATQIVINTPALTANTGLTAIYGPQGTVTCGNNVSPLHANCAGMKHTADAFYASAQPATPRTREFSGVSAFVGNSTTPPMINVIEPNTGAEVVTNPLIYISCAKTPQESVWAGDANTYLGIQTCSDNSSNTIETWQDSGGGSLTFKLTRAGQLYALGGFSTTWNGTGSVLQNLGILPNPTGNATTISMVDNRATAPTWPNVGCIYCADNGGGSDGTEYEDFRYNNTPIWQMTRLGVTTSQLITFSAPAMFKSTGTLSASSVPSFNLQDSGASAASCHSNGSIFCVNVATGSNAYLYDWFNNAVEEAYVDRSGNNWNKGNVTGNTFVSTVATGTAPLTVTSTTKVANLNVSQVNGLTPIKISNSITPAAATASSCVEQTFTYTGLVTTQGVQVSPPSALGAHIWIGSTRVSAADTLAIDFCADATAGTPAAGNYIALAF